MISFINFKNKWYGKYIDYDNVEGYQCVDLGKEWLTENTGKRYGALGDAIKWWTSTAAALLKDCDKVTGSNAHVGDLVVKYPNHVGIATGNINGAQVEILEQNGHTGTGLKTPGNEVRTRWINRSDVAGLLRLKGASHVETVAHGSWRVRSQPNTSSTVLGYVHGGDRYQTVVVAGNWRQVTFNGQTGYIGPAAW